MPRRLTLDALRLAILAGVLSVPLIPLASTFTEDFTTTTYRDEALTTADWDTTAGELRLPPFEPVSLGALDTPGTAEGVAIVSGLAYVADGQAGLQVIDVSDPTAPTVVGALDTPGYAYALAVIGSHAFVADGSSGLRIIDVADPAAPTLVGTYDTPGLAIDLTVDGDLALVADIQGRLVLLDITDVTAPSLLATYGTPPSSNCYDVAVSGDLAFVTVQGAGLLVLDIVDPAAPALLATLSTPGVPDGVAVAGDIVFVADGDQGVQVFDVTDPGAPIPLTSIDTPGFAIDVMVDGDALYVADAGGGLQILDVSDPAQPQPLAGINTVASTRAVAIGGELAYIAEGGAGLRIVRVRELTSTLPMVAQDGTANFARQVAVSGDLALLAGGGTGLQLFDISDPTAPSQVGGYDLPSDSITAVAVAGDLAVVTTNIAGLQTLDISDPANPVLLGSTPSSSGQKIVIAGDLAFVGRSSRWLHIVDISDPAAPSLMSELQFAANAATVAWSGDLLAVGIQNPSRRVALVDISDPQAPAVVGEHVMTNPVDDVAISGQLLLAATPSGAHVVDISDPTSPVLRSIIAGSWNSVFMTGGLAFLGGPSLSVHDLSDPANPVLRASSSDLGGATVSLVVSGDHIFTARRQAGLQVFRAFQRDVILADDTARSLPVDGADRLLVRARLTSNQAGSVAWAVSADGGAGFQSLTPGADWLRLADPGEDLVWRAVLDWSPTASPVVDDVTLQWLNQPADFTAITDVPNDQGGRVRVAFARSGHDFADETDLAITGYQLYRRVDDAQLRKRIREQGAVPSPTLPAGSVAGRSPRSGPAATPRSNPAATPGLAAFAPEHLRALDGEIYVLGRAEGASGEATLATLPPGTWQALTWVAALQQEGYLVEATTAADSSAAGGPAWSVFLTTAHTTTPSIWYASEPDSGYSVDNLAPAMPTGFTVDHDLPGAALAWQASEAEDFASFSVYRGAVPEVPIDPANLVQQTIGTSWYDPDAGPQDHYRLTAIDHAGNESEPAMPQSITAIVSADLPARPTLRGAFPNPFNPATEIRFALPTGGARVELKVYDFAGRLVRTLVDEDLPAGEHTVSWRGADDRGRQVASGVYVCRLRAGETVATRKLNLVK
jgi:hypothetical protein